MALAAAYGGQQAAPQQEQTGDMGSQAADYVRRKQKLAHLAQARQKFTNKQYALSQKEMDEAKANAAKQQEMAKRTGYGLVGTGAALGMTAGPMGALAGGAAGLGLGMLGEMGTRMGEGDNFFEALGKSVGRLPTAAETTSIATGIGGGLLQQAFANQPTAPRHQGPARGLGGMTGPEFAAQRASFDKKFAGMMDDPKYFSGLSDALNTYDPYEAPMAAGHNPRF